jgi:hypothetical protein
MANIASNLTDLIGNTPLPELKNYAAKENVTARIIAKLESFNPASSVKDRIGWAMIKDAEEKGLLSKNSVIIEPTSGNTGIALAFVAAARGYKIILSLQCINSTGEGRFAAPTGLAINAMYGSEFQINSLSWDSSGTYLTQVWRMIDNGTYTIVSDSIETCQFVDSGNTELNLAIYTIRFILPTDKYSLFFQPVGVKTNPDQNNDPNNGTFGPDGFSVQCH